MRKLLVLSVLVLAASGPALELAQAQQETPPAPSLGELAQKLKTDRGKAAQKSGKVFTNDDLPARPPEEGPTAATAMSKTPGEQGGGKEGSNPPPTAASSEAHGEKYFRAAMSQLEGRLEEHQRQLDVLQQQLAQNQTQYYSDPYKGALQEYTRADINKRTQDVAKKQQEIADDQKAMDDLRDELRRVDGDPGWLRGNPPAPIVKAAESAQQASSPEAQEETSGDKKRTKDYWQARFKSARAELAKAEEAQQLLQDEISLLQIQQAQVLDPTVQSDVAQKIAAKQPEVAAARAMTDKARKALGNLQKKFEESGAPEDWSKTE